MIKAVKAVSLLVALGAAGSALPTWLQRSSQPIRLTINQRLTRLAIAAVAALIFMVVSRYG